MFKLLLPARYLLKRRITLLAIAAIALCVFIVVVVMSVMSGLVNDFKQKNHAWAGDAVVTSTSLVGFPYYEDFVDKLREQEFVAAVSPVVQSFGLITQPGRDVNIGMEIVGVDPVLHSRATKWADMLQFGVDPADAFKSDVSALPGCILAPLRLPPGFNPADDLRLEISSFPLKATGALALQGSRIVNTRTFCISNASQSGLVQVDENTVYLPFEEAQKLLEMSGQYPRVSRIHVKFASGVSLSRGTAELRQMWDEYSETIEGRRYANLFDNVRVQSWQTWLRGVIAPMEKEQTMLTILFGMLGIITVFVIFVVFYMIIGHKNKDIGILKSVGASSLDVGGIFMTFAVLVGAVGATIGISGGVLFLSKINAIENWLFEHYHWQLWDRTIYAIGEIPHEVDSGLLSWVFASALAVSVLGAWVPSIQAAKKHPVEVLQVSQA